jgi:hypothetical protein
MPLITLQWYCIMTPAEIAYFFQDIRIIPLTKGYHTVVDLENYEWLNQWKWWAMLGINTVYAVRSVQGYRRREAVIYMHRQIMNTLKGMLTDHRNGDGLMNLRENLRICTEAENTHNMRPRDTRVHKDSSSGYKGVSWINKDKKWRAQITVNYKNINLGRFADEREAALAYNAAALKYHGKFAWLNKL